MKGLLSRIGFFAAAGSLLLGGGSSFLSSPTTLDAVPMEDVTKPRTDFHRVSQQFPTHIHTEKTQTVPQLVFGTLLRPDQLANWRFFEGFVTSINFERRIPNVVVERLTWQYTRDEDGGTANRKLCEFTGTHPSIPKIWCATLEDYRGSGYSRGHMAAAGNYKFNSQDAMCETFILAANVVPQEGQNNGDYWFRMELLARRDLSATFPELFVFSGPLFIPEKVDVDPDKGISRYRRDDVPRYYLRHEVLGGGVSVPTHLFKAFAVRDPNEPSKFALSAFVVKNGPVDGTTPLSHWNVSRDQLSALTGWELLPGENPAPLCGNLYDCDEKFMKEAEYQTYLLGRQIGWARTLEDLEKAWKKAAKNGVQPDEWATTLYNDKKKAFGDASLPQQQEK